MPYDHKEIETKWIQNWSKSNIYKTPSLNSSPHPTSPKGEEQKKKYILEAFPYPSGDGLHVGHALPMTAGDITSRFYRMNGYSVLHPMGWDSFGLPTENFAKKKGLHPQDVTNKAIANFTKQIRRLGIDYDWNKELATSSSEYYKWTQWFFQLMYKRGLAYKKEALVNWDPVDMTVLANEQVLADGTAERSGAKVEQKMMSQWFFKITDYAERLITDLDKLDWPQSTKLMQKNWIGKSSGTEVDFSVIDSNEKIKIFTTRVDTIFGVTYLVLAPEHHLVDDLTSPEQFELVAQYKEKSKQKSQFERTEMNKDKTGVFTGSYCINPFNGAKVPVWVGDYVLASYGTGAVMAVPAHDERDYEFALKYDLEIKQSIAPKDNKAIEGCFTEHGILHNSGSFNGLTTFEAKEKLSTFAQTNGFGNLKTTYRLRDWSIGRQRYWGCPIPVVYDKEGIESLVPVDDLPVLLPQDLDLSTGMIKPLRSNIDFINSGSKYGEGWTREGDTMDTFVCSSWYFFRYCSGNIDTAFADADDMKNWMPVDQYIIGAEHSTMHLLYARFFTKVLFDACYIDFDEPFTKMRHQGLILGPDNAKMSKSKGNVINPNEVFDEYGSDTLRMYEMFMGPFDQPKPWSTSSIKGVRRFLDRVWNMQELVTTNENYDGGMKVEVALHKLVKKIGEDIESYGFNTCVSEFMKFVNLVEEIKGIHNVQYGWFLRVLAPFAPFITEEIWNNGQYSETSPQSPHPNPLPRAEGTTYNSIHLQPWPQYYPEFLVEDTVTIGVQINGKVRGQITISPTETEENAKAKVMELDFVIRNIEGKQVRKFVYVPGKIVNLVVG